MCVEAFARLKGKPARVTVKMYCVYNTDTMYNVELVEEGSRSGEAKYFLELGAQNRLHIMRLNPLITKHPKKALTEISRTPQSY